MLVWNQNNALGATAKKKSVTWDDLTNIEKISIVGITVSVVSLAWSIYTFNCKKAAK